MLFLKRRPKQKIYIMCPDGQKIEITLDSIVNKQAKIGIDASSQYTILRDELLLRDKK